jgi:hypothetical protein
MQCSPIVTLTETAFGEFYRIGSQVDHGKQTENKLAENDAANKRRVKARFDGDFSVAHIASTNTGGTTCAPRHGLP